MPDFLGLNEPDCQRGLLCVDGIKEQNGFKVTFLAQKETGSDGSAFPGAKCVVQADGMCGCFEHHSEPAGVMRVKVAELAWHDGIAAGVRSDAEAVLMDEIGKR